ncbi:MAG: tetratricopeptide repeat protein [Flavobacteriaceae bacterium]|jgi:tetratricopeptide (TPR) repeat protein|nr:tetratricopeptide repeat protein [Flavobacteriaceae bacterium]
MKTKYYIVSALLVCSGLFAQKDELKTLKRVYGKDVPSAKDISQYKEAIAKAEPLMASASESDKIYFEYYKSMVPMIEMDEKNPDPQSMFKAFTPAKIAKIAENSNKVIEFEKQSGVKQVLTKDIQQGIEEFKPFLLNYAIQLGNSERYSDAASVLHSLYLFDTKDQEKLYYAASYAVNGKDYNTALVYYDELIKLGYTGEGMGYYAKSIISNQEEMFTNKTEMDKAVNLKTHTHPRVEKIPSKRGEIYTNYALILIEQGKTDQAKKAIRDARNVNPDDAGLIVSEANIYYNEEDYQTYSKILEEAAVRNPNNHEIFYNLGIAAMKVQDYKRAEQYYDKAIQLDPKYSNAYLNMAIVKLDKDDKMVEEMNSLGNTPKENKRYEELKVERVKLFNDAMPYLEKYVELEPSDEDAKRTLLNIYLFLELTDKHKKLKDSMN